MVSRVSVIGLGKLGACIAATMASKGFQVIGVDTSEQNVKLLNRGEAPVVEPGLPEMISQNRARLSATTDCRAAVRDSDATFIIVPTPSEEQGGFSLRYVVQAAREIGAALGDKDCYHLVALTSTVLPGATQQCVLPILESVSGRVCGRDFGLCYNPEFIALGSVIRDLLNPDFILIGESDPQAGSVLEAFYGRLCDNAPPVARMNFVNAELAKISVNTYVTTKISFANMLAGICEGLPGADIDVVSAALGLDSRIGRRYLTGGQGYGGPCFPRDNRALIFTAARAGASARLAEATDEMNRYVNDRQAAAIRQQLQPGMCVCLLGLSYKPDTNVVEESQSLALAARLAEDGFRVTVYDDLAALNARNVLGERVSYAASVTEAVRYADAVVIGTQAPELCALGPADFPRRQPPIIVFDFWRSLRSSLSGCNWIRYSPFGVGIAEDGRSAKAAEGCGALPETTTA